MCIYARADGPLSNRVYTRILIYAKLSAHFMKKVFLHFSQIFSRESLRNSTGFSIQSTKNATRPASTHPKYARVRNINNITIPKRVRLFARRNIFNRITFLLYFSYNVWGHRVALRFFMHSGIFCLHGCCKNIPSTI